MKNILIKSILLVTIAITIAACKKDYIYGNIVPNTDRPMVEFTDSKNSGTLSLSYGTSQVDTGLTEIRFNPRSTVTQNSVVEFKLNNTIISDYNTANGTAFAPLPANAYTITANQVTLTPSERKKKIPIKLLPSAIVGGAYALGVTITTSSYGEISSVAHDVLVVVQVKNDYEGMYHATGQRTLFNGPTEASGIANVINIDADKYLYTIDQTTSETDVADLIGSAWMFLTVNPSTHAVTVSPSTVSPTFALSNNGSCTYDPQSKTFTLHYKYFNGAGNLREITETIVAK